MNANALNLCLLIVAWALIVSGAFLIYPPAALITGGLLIAFDVYR